MAKATFWIVNRSWSAYWNDNLGNNLKWGICITMGAFLDSSCL